MKKIKLKYFDFKDLAFFLLSVDSTIIQNLGRELKLPDSGSPYHNWGYVTIKDVLQALEKRLIISKDKRKEVNNLLKSLGYIK